MLKPYPWQARQWRQLLNAAQQGRLPHALLLAGAEGLGVEDFALALAARLLCTDPGEGACGRCKSCLLLQAGNHPDLVLLQPGEAGLWLHQRWPTTDEATSRERFEQFCNALPSSLRIVRTSPFAIDGRPVGHGTALLMGREDDVAGATAVVMPPSGPAAG